MPAPLAAAAIAGGAAVLGSGINAASTSINNRKQRQWAERMYDRQYTDNVDFWNMQNEYNSPQQQMQRLQEAGLNPNMVYGQSSGGAAGQASPINTPDVQSFQSRSPEWGNAITEGASAIMSIYDLDIKQAQLANLKAQNTVQLEEAMLKEAMRNNISVKTDSSKFDLDFKSELRSFSAEAKKESLRQMKANTQMVLSENERRAALNKATLQEKAEAVLNLRATRAKTEAERNNAVAALKGIQQDSRIKELDRQLREIRINPNDPIWARILGHLLNDQKPFKQ